MVEWDPKGNKLLIGDESGSMQTWSMVDYMINKWDQTHSVCFSGESILAGVWFNQGKKLKINYDRKDLDLPYQEKYYLAKFSESVLQFAGKAAEGYICINSSGLVFVQLITADGEYLNTVDFLSSCRMHIDYLDIAYQADGSFLVATASHNTDRPISCYKIKVSCQIYGKPKICVTCKPFNGLQLEEEASGYSRKITHLRFAIKEDPEDLIVVTEGSDGSKIELWTLEEKTLVVPTLISNLLRQRQQYNDDNDKEMSDEIKNYKVLGWTKKTEPVCSSSAVLSLGVSYSALFASKPALSYVVVAYEDGTIKCLYRQDLQNVAALAWRSSAVGRRIESMHLSWSSSVLVVLDDLGQLCLYRLPPLGEPGQAMSVGYAQSMLEYSLISGHDYWDILVNIKPSFVDKLCERINENFVFKLSQSNSLTQAKWLDNVLQLKATLYRCVSSLSTHFSCTAGDCYTLRMLNAVSETIKRLIRPSRECQENVAERLSVLIQKKPTDILLSELIPKLEPKDYFIEQPVHQSFQNLLQWVCDLALYLLSSLSHQLQSGRAAEMPGVSVNKEIEVVSM